MNFSILHDLAPISLIGGGIVDEIDIIDATRFGQRIVAVDGGLDRALDHNLHPDAVIGDLDSVTNAALAQMPLDSVHHIAEQETTDFDKALRSIAAPLIIGIGFTGGRMDHQMAAFHTLVRHAHRPCVLLAPQEVIFVAPPEISINLERGDAVSLFPMGAVSGRSTGLKWPIDGLNFAPDRKIGTSNQATGPVQMSFDAAAMLVFVPRYALEAVVNSLMEPQAQAVTWPVPA